MRADEFKCKTGDQCISKNHLCDGDKDCRDGSDEEANVDGPCNAKTNCTQLGNDGFRCNDKQCIRKVLLCDGIPHCTNGMDEKSENCVNKTCKETEFRCNDSRSCIPKTWQCDGMPDCIDHSDEQNCGECIEFTCKNTVCLLFEKKCDGVNDCGDYSDESDCENYCQQDELYCPFKGCLSPAQICDGNVDCFNRYDELGCEEKTTNRNNNFHLNTTLSLICGIDEFRCAQSFECIPKVLQCNNISECLDGSDEKNCSARPMHNGTHVIETFLGRDQCEYPDRVCNETGACIHVEQLCDGRSDCPDGTDEGFHCELNLCKRTSECSHMCHNAPEGYVCSCPPNMFLKADGKQCTFEHACEHWGTCSQLCEQNGKHFKCKCLDGYSLESDQFTCRSNNPDQAYVIFSNREEIRGVDLKRFFVKNFYSSLRNVIALDFLYTNDSLQIFWTDVIDDKIYR